MDKSSTLWYIVEDGESSVCLMGFLPREASIFERDATEYGSTFSLIGQGQSAEEEARDQLDPWVEHYEVYYPKSNEHEANNTSLETGPHSTSEYPTCPWTDGEMERMWSQCDDEPEANNTSLETGPRSTSERPTTCPWTDGEMEGMWSQCDDEPESNPGAESSLSERLGSLELNTVEYRPPQGAPHHPDSQGTCLNPPWSTPSLDSQGINLIPTRSTPSLDSQGTNLNPTRSTPSHNSQGTNLSQALISRSTPSHHSQGTEQGGYTPNPNGGPDSRRPNPTNAPDSRPKCS